MNENDLTHNLKAGDENYKAYVGPLKNYDILSIVQFSVLAQLNLRQTKTILDIGCGSLRLGKILIPFLKKGNYYGIDPNPWLIKEALKNELGNSIMDVKKPNFFHFDNFELSSIGKEFDMMMAHSIFTHASEKQIRKCLSEVKLTLKKDGIFAGNFQVGTENYTGEEWVYPGCVTYKNNFIGQMANEAGLNVVYSEWKTPHTYKTHIFCQPSKFNVLKKHISNRGKIISSH